MSDLSGLKAKLRSDVISSVETEVYKVAENVLFEAIRDTLYASPSGSNYFRTGDFMRAVDIQDKKNTGSSASFTVIVNGSMLTPRKIGDSDDWNSHMDTFGNAWNGDGIVEVMDQGTDNPKSLYPHKGHHFYEKAEETIEVKVLRAMVRAMKSRGWDVRIV